MISTYNLINNLAISCTDGSENERNEIILFYKEIGREKAFEYATKKKMLPFIAQLFCDLEIDFDFWNEQIEFYNKRNVAVIEILSEVFIDFHNAGVFDVFVYENFGALLSSKSNVALFASGDVDLYADVSQKSKIYSVLKDHGFLAQNEGDNSEKVKIEFLNSNLFNKGFGINVMWTPMSRLKLPFNIDIEYCVSKDTLIKYKNTEIMLPSNEALLYLCLLHISIHSYARSPDIRLYIDIVNMCKLDMDWRKVMAYAEYDHTIIRVLTASVLTKKLLSVEIPDYVLDYRFSYETQISRLLKLVYDEINNCLLYEPRGFKVIEIEALSEDRGPFFGIMKILFPNKEWVKEFYEGDKGNFIVAYLKHIKNLLWQGT